MVKSIELSFVFLSCLQVLKVYGSKCNSGSNGSECCFGFTWIQSLGKCISCTIGYIGSDCKLPCRYPSYGHLCQSACDCVVTYCDHIYGCRNPEDENFTTPLYVYTETPQLRTTESPERMSFTENYQENLSTERYTLKTDSLTTRIVFSRNYIYSQSQRPENDIYTTSKEACEVGYHGSDCEKRCPYPSYGQNCALKCNCIDKDCHYQNGCNKTGGACEVGYHGSDCAKHCPYPSYGQNCALRCNCIDKDCHYQNGCNKSRGDINGTIAKGQTTEKTINRRGNTKHIHGTIAKSHTTEITIKRTGNTKPCETGFNGSSCYQQCPYPSYGLNCASKCNCIYKDCHYQYGCKKSRGDILGTITKGHITEKTIKKSGNTKRNS
ncbi:uncharacterized protein LOC111111803 [Crassostrea virginica]